MSWTNITPRDQKIFQIYNNLSTLEKEKLRGGGIMEKVLKIKVGEAYINNKSVPVFQTAWMKKSKDGKTTYYKVESPIFIQEINRKPETEYVENI